MDATATVTMDWKKSGRMQALLSQVISVGVTAFLSGKANVKADAARGIKAQTYDQKAVWTNPVNGILTMLKKHDAFEGADPLC